MLDSTDPKTFKALRELIRIAQNGDKPLGIWVGAGASRWAGLPGWDSLAQHMHRVFGKEVPDYNRIEANALIDRRKLPEFFNLCKTISPTRFHKIIHTELQPSGKESPVYERFINVMRDFSDSIILTTNADDLLERRLGLPVAVATSLELVHDFIRRKKGLIVKIHGSVNDMATLVFDSAAYVKLIQNETFMNHFQQTMQSLSIIFVGYGLADRYILDLIEKNVRINTFFGDGPHFACLCDTDAILPDSIRPIRYRTEPHRDHRSAILILEEVRRAKSSDQPPAPVFNHKHLLSGHLLSSIVPEGIWRTSQTVRIARPDGSGGAMLHVGSGFTQAEMPITYSTTMHDLIVGLLCFDRAYIPLQIADELFKLVGEPAFLELTSADTLRFVRIKRRPAMLYSDTDKASGSLGAVSHGEWDTLPLTDLIRKQFSAKPGHEAKAEAHITSIIEKVIETDLANQDQIPFRVRDALVLPSLRELLGISEAIKVESIPPWLKFQVLRLAEVFRIATVSQELGLASIKFDFGCDLLASHAFANPDSVDSIDQNASYVTAGNFSTDLGAYVRENPETFRSILRFRDTQEGQLFRKAILDCLTRSEGSEIASAINGGLSRIIPRSILDAARSNFSRLSLSASSRRLPAAWHNANHADAALTLWRKKAGEDFRELCRKQKVSAYDLCPCGSGEKVKWCCGETLGFP